MSLKSIRTSEGLGCCGLDASQIRYDDRERGAHRSAVEVSEGFRVGRVGGGKESRPSDSDLCVRWITDPLKKQLEEANNMIMDLRQQMAEPRFIC